VKELNPLAAFLARGFFVINFNFSMFYKEEGLKIE